MCIYSRVPTTSTWKPEKLAWVNVNKFYDYMSSNGYILSSTTNKNAKLGDIVQLYNSSV
ncbi:MULTISPECIES: hypothetical protein [unclassified Clostridium]|uniref:hypothetical protein n=1 Tax=unclassified Clostridium TaxID=2614128 RepID=UPI000B19CA7D|nr:MULTISPECIES: hypothetical protein [unclassified Clostridium]